MSPPHTHRRFPWRGLALVLGVAVLFVVFPPVRCVRAGADGKPAGAAAGVPLAFEPVGFATTLWAERLQPAATRAPALAPVVLTVQADPVAAAKQHGHKVGEGTTWYYFVRGSGRVTAVEKSRLLLEVEGAPGLLVALRTGPVFGNAVRDGSGLVELNSVPGLTEFNAVSAELNRLVERTVQPALKQGIAVGARISFAGCAEAPENAGAGPLLLIVPVQAEVLR